MPLKKYKSLNDLQHHSQYQEDQVHHGNQVHSQPQEYLVHNQDHQELTEDQSDRASVSHQDREKEKIQKRPEILQKEQNNGTKSEKKLILSMDIPDGL